MTAAVLRESLSRDRMMRASIPVQLRCRPWLLVAFAVALYIYGYAWSRVNELLVHRTAYTTVAGKTRYLHSVEAGDFGPGIAQGPVLPWIVAGADLVFTPLCWVESIYWAEKSP
jgi:hypothetical protein